MVLDLSLHGSCLSQRIDYSPCDRVSLFYVNDLDQQGPGGAPGGFPVYTLHLNSDAGYAVLPLVRDCDA